MQPEPVIYRQEVTNMLFTIIDISAKLDTIIELLRDEDGEEEE